MPRLGVAADPSGHLTLFNRASHDWHDLDADRSKDSEEFADHYDLYRSDAVTPLPAEEIPLLRALRDGAVSDAEMVIRPHARPTRHIAASGRSWKPPTPTWLNNVTSWPPPSRSSSDPTPNWNPSPEWSATTCSRR
ncbi:hypothetical protein [Cryptosporangium sp. NPDC048952]|uniref:hypothetical protein n=1 Tax=Cryptosporangium sp. NPDC048952 TaxID=3363961 RepID=UPI00371CEFA0